MDLGKLQDWTQKVIKQEQHNCVASCEIYTDATETLSKKVKTLRRKIQDVTASRVEDLPPSPKRQRTGGQDLSHLFGPIEAATSAPPPPPVATDSTNKKEPRNLSLPAKYNGTSTKLKEFRSKVESTFERMPQTHSTINDKILFIVDLLTNSAYTGMQRTNTRCIQTLSLATLSGIHLPSLNANSRRRTRTHMNLVRQRQNSKKSSRGRARL